MKKSPTTRDSSDMDKRIIEWQLPVTDDLLKGTGYKIHGNTKIHCYYNGNALCSSKYWLAPRNFETTEFGEKDIDTHPEYFCKKCVKKFKKITAHPAQPPDRKSVV